ncbi:mitochondrial 54S ribosomal protein uL10m Ecym_4121 [Eremothecium cymbalariae DBVPG|uniref:Ribosomal protein L10 n=1 Tax=Eremothecium cymbalariae (strain CBS 270.75 / DBVPG 7215 / KCTC 17166 / NRRL Y-17582) TaxID=931890 RepID=G8JT47_ERECY|nr:hypothetical protein Ecym_4121 [Eremothecium cymbalariae DBVPG\
MQSFHSLCPSKICAFRASLQRGFSGISITRYASTNASRVTVKPVGSRKTFLLDSYKHLMESHPVVLFLHHNNLMKQETAHFRQEIQQLGGRMMVIRNHLFEVYLRNSHRDDPAAPVKSEEQNWNHPLLPLFRGPTAAVAFKDADPHGVSRLLKLLEKAQDKLFVVGAKVESEVFNVEQLQKFKSLPAKPELQGQLLSVLHVLSGAGLIRTLEAGSQVLYLTLKSHEDNINPEKNNKDGSGGI